MTIKNIGQGSVGYNYLDIIIIVAYPSRFPPMSSVSFHPIDLSNSSYYSEIISNQNSLLGLFKFVAFNGTSFRWSILNNLASVTQSNITLTFWVVFTLNIFSNGVCCGYTPFIDIVNNNCQSQCPGNTTADKCYLCLRNSMINATTNICNDCPPQSVLNHTTGVCSKCENNTILDTSTNTCR